MIARATAVALTVVVLSGCGGDDAGGERFLRAPVSPTVQPAETVEPARFEVVPAAPPASRFDPHRIYEREAPGVVTVISLFGGGDDARANRDDQGVGSGFVLSGRGEIVTNAHVVTAGEGRGARRASEVFVEFADSNKVAARILGADFDADIALLKVDPAGLSLRPLPLGRSDRMQVGEPVAAIGSPFGERQSLSVGVVSALDRSIRSLTAFDIPGAIQTDAAVNPGNSGGPLVNARGQVIGINQQIRSSTGGGEGVGFAVPIDLVKRSVAQLRSDGQAEYAYLGVATVALYPQLVQRFGLPVARGVWVQSVSGGAPAAHAGLRGGEGNRVSFQGEDYWTGGDVVTRLGDQPVRDADDLALAVTRYQPGDEVDIEVWRDGRRREVTVTLARRPTADGDTP